MKKRVLLLLMTAVMSCALLVGCGGQSFDASAYIEATLQYMKTGSTEDRDALAKYTDGTAEEIEEEYNEVFATVESQMNAQMESAGVTMTEEASARMNSMVKSLFSTMSFTVGEATENEDGSFDVPVDIEPMQFTADMTTIQQEYLSNLDYSQYIGTGMSEDEIKSAVVNDFIIVYCDEIDKDFASPTYGDAETVTVHIEKDEDGIYEPDESDMEEVGQTIAKGLADVG